MTTKVFISYSHKDEDFKNDLVEHLSGLIKSGIISEWNDRKIIPGEDWRGQIDDNLSKADLILFLVSSSFLSSEYCTDIEAQSALKKHQEGSAQLIPIVIRPVVWSESPLSKLQGLPKDAHAVNSSHWANADEAWVSVVQGIQRHLQEFTPKLIKSMASLPHQNMSLTDSMLEWLEDTEITLTHRHVNRIKLSDIYTIPDVEIESSNSTTMRSFRNAGELIEDFNCVIVFGEEQQGKSSLLKHYFRILAENSEYPIVLDGKDIKDANPEVCIKKALSNQYADLSFETFINSPNKILLIDNLDTIPLNRKHRDRFVSSVCNLFHRCIFTLERSFSLLVDEIPALDRFGRAELLALGNKKREEIIQKWISLGREQTISDVDLYQKCDELVSSINSVVKKNIVPPKPIYILMVLQTFEAQAKLNLELSSHGHCYQHLIYQSLKNAGVSEREYDKYLNVLTELSWWIFQNAENLNEAQLETFFQEYKKTYLGIDHSNVVQKLSDHSILENDGIRIGFKYPYIYYFFVGKKISESYGDEAIVQEKMVNLLENLHREDYANILIFVAHHTKESWVINKLEVVLSDQFREHQQATLNRQQLSFMDQFMKQIPDLVLEQREVQKERDRRNEELDRNERQNKEPKDLDSPDVLANINKTFKGMEIAGQIIRNRHASLKRDALSSLAEQGIGSGLRFLDYFISITDVAKNEIIKVISTHLLENPELTDGQIEKVAEDAYLHLTYGVINFGVRKIASSIGSREAFEIYTELEEKSSTPALILLKQSIELHFMKRVDVKSIARTLESLKGNHVCTRILKELVVQHIYLFPLDYKEKQQLARLLGLSVQKQQIVEQHRIRIR